MDVLYESRSGGRRAAIGGLPLGYLTHVSGSGAPARVYRESIELAVAAEELGYSSFWIAQHHGGGLDGLLPSPLLLLAAIAERTSTIRLGTAVVAAALEDPLRLTEDAAVADTLSGGRIELGFGAGADAAASATFGRDHDRRHQDCAAAVDRVIAELDGSWLVPAAPGLRRRLWQATGSTAGVDAAAARGIGLLSGRPADLPGVTADLARYWSRTVGEPRVAVCRIVAADEAPTAILGRWAQDPAREWATELVVQTQPAGTPFATHLRTLRALAGVGAGTGPSGRTAMPAGTGSARAATR
jgi:alkanesulfonate monooxygenase SsuD/methylene tetrahydromethanopterin reductase-like flavin-dependent oxidoreductase (luciferase family)